MHVAATDYNIVVRPWESSHGGNLKLHLSLSNVIPCIADVLW